MEPIKDYDCTIDYHPSKANVVMDTLSSKPTISLASIRAVQTPLMLELRRLDAGLEVDTSGALLVSFNVRPLLLGEIYEAQLQDLPLIEARGMAQNGAPSNFTVRRDGLLLFKNRVCVLTVESLKELILQEAHGSAYAIHPRSTKMYHNLRETYW